MLPIINTVGNYNTLPPPLVNTAMPGSTVVHTPYDNVAPSVSSAQVDNNARGNSTLPAATETTLVAANSNSAQAASASADGGDFSSSTAQTAFITQLLGQDVSPETQVVLVQYEKLIALSNVKFKPSYAFKPAAEPSSLFGQILHQDNPAPTQPATQIQALPVIAQQTPARDSAQLVLPFALPTLVQSQPDPQAAPDITVHAAQPTLPATSPQVSDAYTASLLRPVLQLTSGIAEVA